VRTFRPAQHVLTLLAIALLVSCGESDTEALERIRSGLQASDKKAQAEALVKVKALLQTQPSLAPARLLLANHLQTQGDHAGARIEYQRALDHGAKLEQVLPRLAKAMIYSGQAGQVPTQFAEQALADPQAQADLKAVVAQAMLKLGDLNGAAEAAAAALKVVPEHPGALLVQARLAELEGDKDRAISLADALLARHPNDADAQAFRGYLWLGQPNGRDGARLAFGKAVEIDPRNLYALAQLVSLALVSDDLASARKAMQQLREAGPGLLITGQQEAALAYASGDHVRAREILQQLLRTAPDQVMLLLMAGQTELKLGGAVQAETMFAKALALQPHFGSARRLLAQAQLALGQVPKALATLQPLLDSPEVDAEVLTLAAEAQLQNGNAKAADALFARAARMKPTDPQVRTRLATAALGRESDQFVFTELNTIAAQDSGITAEMALVSTYLRRGLTDEALKTLDAIDRKRPKEAGHHMLRGQILAGRNDLAGARKALEAALAAEPGHLKAVVGLASLDLRENKADAAKERIQALLKQQPRNTSALLAMAELLGRDPAQDAERRKLLLRAVETDPVNPNARTALVAAHLENNDTDSALAAAQAAVAAMPQSIEMLELVANCHQRKGELSQALSTYNKMASTAPRDPRGHVGAAGMQLRAGDLDNAGRSIERGLKAIPSSRELVSLSVALAMARRQPDEARRMAQAVQKDRPGEAMGWALEGDIEASLQRWGPAAAAFRTALDKQAATGVMVKYLYVLQQDGRTAEARSVAAARLKAQPTDQELLFTLGDNAQREGDLAQARQHYEAILRLNPDHMLALNNLATVLVAQKQPGALALAQRAVLLAPRQPAVLDTLAQAEAAEGKLGDAVVTQRKAVVLAPGMPAFRLTYAKLLIRNGDRVEAKQQLAQLASLGAGFGAQAEVGALMQSLDAGPAKR
jgi:cellulose synthase operon protein C